MPSGLDNWKSSVIYGLCHLTKLLEKEMKFDVRSKNVLFLFVYFWMWRYHILKEITTNIPCPWIAREAILNTIFLKRSPDLTDP